MAIERSVRINVQTGNAKAELNGLAKSLRDTDKAAEGSAAASDRAEKEYRSLGTAAAQSAKQNTTLSTSLASASKTADATGKSLGGMGRKAGAAGIQIQQFVGQVQGGVSPMVAMSQQAADLGIVLGAPLVGAVVGIAAALGGPLIAAMSDAADETDRATELFEELIDKYDELGAARQSFLSGIAFDKIDELTQKNKELRNEQESLQKTLQSPIRFPDEELKRLSDRYRLVSAEIEENESKIEDLRGSTDDSKTVIEEMISALNEEADTYGKSARAIAIYQAQLKGANPDQIAEINSIYDKIEALEAEEEARDKADIAARRAAAEAKRRSDQQARQLENQRQSNANLVDSLENQLVVALAKTEKEAAILTATQRLNAQATDEQREAVASLAERLYDLRNAGQTYDELKAKLDPLAALTASYRSVVDDVIKADLTAAQERELLTIATERYANALNEAKTQQQLNAETEQSYFGAFGQGLSDSLLTAESTYDQIRESGTTAISGLSDALANYIATGEGDFRSFAASIIAELLRVQTQALITQAAMSLFGIGGGAAQNVSSVASSAGYSTSGYAGAFGFARGGVVDHKYANGGLPSLGDFSNSVVSTPTKFAMGGGATGQMGEAGAEAILPLQRTAGGELGVKADTGQQQAAPNVMVDVPVRVVNVAQDPQEWANSPAGERVIVNIMNRNRGALQ